MALGVNWIYIGGFVELQCAFQLTHAVTLCSVLVVLYVPCIVLNILIYIKTKESLPRQQLAVSGRRAAAATMSVHVNSNTLHRMELEASRVFITGVTPLLLLPCPLIGFTVFHLICLALNSTGGSGQCNNSVWMAPYFKQLVTLHAVVHPLIYLCRSKEFFAPDNTSSTPASAVIANNIALDHRPVAQQQNVDELYG